jgi:hypothetical protein
MSTFCSLEEAFALSSAAPAAPAGKKKHRTKAAAVPVAAPSTPDTDPDRQAQIQPVADDVLAGGPEHGSVSKLAAANVVVSDGVKLDDMFPLPGETGDGDEWEKAFILPGSRMPMAIPVDGKSTLWRQIPAPVVAPPAPAPMPGSGSELAALAPAEVSARLDALTRQLESLTTPAPLQSTAELFLFVAIGLLILLAIDTLLRFAVRMASGVVRMSGGGLRRGGGRFRFGGGGYRSRWY